MMVSSLRVSTIAEQIVALIASLDRIDTRFLAIQSVEDWFAVWRADYADEREHPDLIDLGGEG